jgi:CheY-like chemotaxis protein
VVRHGGFESKCNRFLAQRRKGTGSVIDLRSKFAPGRLYAKYFSTPRARNDYATHVPIIIGLARVREIKNVLELGCGYYSTLTFLNRKAFPYLERLQSVENDASWAEIVAEIARSNERSTLTFAEGEIADAIANIDLEQFDLILVDDSKTAAQRSETIRAISAKEPRRPWIAIHDFEVSDYRRAAANFRQKYAFKIYNPWTGLVWNGLTETRTMRALERSLKDHSKTLEPDDVKGWINALTTDRY